MRSLYDKKGAVPCEVVIRGMVYPDELMLFNFSEPNNSSLGSIVVEQCIHGAAALGLHHTTCAE